MSKADFEKVFAENHPELMPKLHEIDERSKLCYDDIENFTRIMRTYADNGIPLLDLSPEDSVVTKVEKLRGAIRHEDPYVLYIDDEEINLKVFKFSFEQEDFKILTAKNADEGLMLLDRYDVAVLVSDQRMPGMNGTDLLALVWERYPRVQRILTSAYVDEDSVVHDIRSGRISCFVKKPWNAKKLVDHMRAGIESYRSERLSPQVQVR